MSKFRKGLTALALAGMAGTAIAAEGLVNAEPGVEAGGLGLGRAATPEEIELWDIDVRPDGLGLPEGSGTVSMGEEVWEERCTFCHGTFGEGEGRWPVIAGGFDTLASDDPVKTVGSYWPYLSTVFDYVHRAMPYGEAQSLTDDEVYAVVAYILYLNDVVDDEEFELSKANFLDITMPNESGFIEDTRVKEPGFVAAQQREEPCMTDCKPAPAEVTMRARILDVTPGGEDDESGAGAID